MGKTVMVEDVSILIKPFVQARMPMRLLFEMKYIEVISIKLSEVIQFHL